MQPSEKYELNIKTKAFQIINDPSLCNFYILWEALEMSKSHQGVDRMSFKLSLILTASYFKQALLQVFQKIV